ncbi:hypothetical protein [Adlercreutzia equolifaciens]|uniref:hypothetical protein n=1 Tax=Adlercreutzia equolifaciens TaxID=446660 RepID=UPI00399D04A5
MSGLLKFFSDVIGDNLAGAMAFAFIVYILTQFVLAMFQHRADRRAYRYERSSAIGKMRFEKEGYHIEKVSRSLLALIVATEQLPDGKTNGCYPSSIREKWEGRLDECVLAMGSAAPFLNFIDLGSGKSMCGVRDRRLAEGCLSSGGEMMAYCGGYDDSSLYLRAVRIAEECSRIACDRGAIGREKMLRIFPNALDGAGPTKNCEGCPAARIAAKADGASAAQEVPNATPEASYAALREMYGRFLNCAYCRLKDCETGTRDARRQRRRELRTRWIKNLFPGASRYFDARCTVRGERGSWDDVSPSERWRLAFAVAIPVCLCVWLLTLLLNLGWSELMTGICSVACFSSPVDIFAFRPLGPALVLLAVIAVPCIALGINATKEKGSACWRRVESGEGEPSLRKDGRRGAFGRILLIITAVALTTFLTMCSAPACDPGDVGNGSAVTEDTS